MNLLLIGLHSGGEGTHAEWIIDKFLDFFEFPCFQCKLYLPGLLFFMLTWSIVSEWVHSVRTNIKILFYQAINMFKKTSSKYKAGN